LAWLDSRLKKAEEDLKGVQFHNSFLTVGKVNSVTSPPSTPRRKTSGNQERFTVQQHTLNYSKTQNVCR